MQHSRSILADSAARSMDCGEVDAEQVYGSIGQRVARALHHCKAKLRAKERERVAWLARFIGRDAVIFDVGAHFGYFSKEFARLHDGSCRVHAFEPLAYNYRILESVTARFPNVHAWRKALSETEGTADLFTPVKRRDRIGPGLAHLGPEVARRYVRESVETVRLDGFVAAAGIDRLDFIKCDVEGAELMALRGAEGTLRRFRPTLFTEVNADYMARVGCDPATLFRFLSHLGYAAAWVAGPADRLVEQRVSEYLAPGDYLFRARAAAEGPEHARSPFRPSRA